jgi:hypothetical protein
MKRRSVLAGLLLAPWVAVGAAATFLQSCGSDLYTTTMAMCTGTAPDSVSVTNAHTHALCVPQSLLDAPATMTLMLQYSAGHTHQITLSQTQVANIVAGAPVSQISNPDVLHQHTAFFNGA